ncbi:hypothetical protein KI387_003067, partial [Taxus chinensis]
MVPSRAKPSRERAEATEPSRAEDVVRGIKDRRSCFPCRIWRAMYFWRTPWRNPNCARQRVLFGIFLTDF